MVLRNFEMRTPSSWREASLGSLDLKGNLVQTLLMTSRPWFLTKLLKSLTWYKASTGETTEYVTIADTFKGEPRASGTDDPGRLKVCTFVEILLNETQQG